jgi:hypothetical protein
MIRAQGNHFGVAIPCYESLVREQSNATRESSYRETRILAASSSVSYPAVPIYINVAAAGYAQFIKRTIDSGPGIVSKVVSKQFAELIEAPLGELAKTPLVIIIDALDECESRRC